MFFFAFFRKCQPPGEPEPSPREGQPMRWLPTAELDRVPMLPGDTDFAHRLAVSEKSEKNNDPGQ